MKWFTGYASAKDASRTSLFIAGFAQQVNREISHALFSQFVTHLLGPGTDPLRRLGFNWLALEDMFQNSLGVSRFLRRSFANIGTHI